MKRSIISALAVVFMLVLFTSLSNAQSNGKGTKGGNPGAPKINWVDANGDGICDNLGTGSQGSLNGKGYGVKDGSGQRVRPQDGTGYGKKGGMRTGAGTCDGTGPKGKTTRGGK